ncbi:MAG: FecR family protein [Prevotella sp.]
MKDEFNEKDEERLEEKVNRIIADPTAVDEAELHRLTHNPDFCRAYNDALLINAALHDEPDKPDFREVVGTTQRKPTGKMGMTAALWIAAAAACVMAMFLIDGLKNVDADKEEGMSLEYRANKGNTEITIVHNGIETPLDEAQKEVVATVRKSEIAIVPTADKQDNTTTIIRVPQGKVACLRLDDGTRVWLNADSRIMFPERFAAKGERKVEIEGEVFFDVAHDSRRPFVVAFTKGELTVLGTRFNVRAYANEAPQVTLVSGAVRLQTTRRHTVMRPGQMVEIASDDEIAVSTVDVEEAMAWTEGHLYMNRKAFRDVMIEIGRQYNKNIMFKSNTYKNDTVHFCIERSWSLSDVVGTLGDITDADISVKGDNIEIE